MALVKNPGVEWFLIYHPETPHAEIICCRPAAHDRALLDFCYEYLGCSSIEIVKPCALDQMKESLLMVVDEEGLLRERTANPMGSLLYGHLIVGPVIVGQPVIRDGEPDVGGFDSIEEAIRISEKLHKFRVEGRCI